MDGATGRTDWDGEDYARRIAERTAELDDPHGEVHFLGRFAPRTVLDGGCGTGRVAAELHRRGTEVVGVDVDPSMLTVARRAAPEVPFVESDLTTLALDQRFDVVLLAGNVPLFTPPGTTAALVAACAAHLAEHGHLVAGFSLDRGYDLATYDAEAEAAGLQLVERYATWDREPFEGGDYAVSVHRAAT